MTLQSKRGRQTLKKKSCFHLNVATSMLYCVLTTFPVSHRDFQTFIFTDSDDKELQMKTGNCAACAFLVIVHTVHNSRQNAAWLLVIICCHVFHSMNTFTRLFPESINPRACPWYSANSKPLFCPSRRNQPHQHQLLSGAHPSSFVLQDVRRVRQIHRVSEKVCRVE